MKTSEEIKDSFAKRRPRLFLSIVAVGFAMVLGLVWVGFNYFGNYAAKTARPLEAALVKAGAVKKCGGGDGGRSVDNTQPWYNALYELPESRKKAIDVINKIAADNGYNLKHASKTDKGPLSVDDKYIDNWFYDSVGKPSPYNDLEPGKVDLSFVVNNDGPFEVSHLSCGTSEPVKVNSGATATAISVEVKLPGFKQ